MREVRMPPSSSLGRRSHHVLMKGLNPRFLGSTYTMPHREMVAGEAYCRSATSKSSLQWSVTRMRSELGSVSSLLSSITEFMFSTHTASTSPSSTIHLRSSLSGLGSGLFTSRKMLLSSPSVQSRVSGSITPYSSATLCALGLSTYSLVVTPILVCERASVLMMTLLPPPVLPTTMVVCRVCIVSYSCTHLSTSSEGSSSTW
mmetsp:Transcript_33746/g.73750  ORF Transcript_33746/g.73750 Transcript_33746/m.73750 type:complete len:202 (-) Transcript_33746:421-1026(-)